MPARLIRRDEIPSLIEEVFGKEELLQVELTSDGLFIRKAEDVVEKTRGTIKLDPETVKIIAEGEELSGY